MSLLADFLRSLLHALFIPLWFLGSGWACYCIWTDSATWLDMRSYVQVEARVVDVKLENRRSRKTSSVSEQVLYTYSFDGSDYDGTDRGRTRVRHADTAADMLSTAPRGKVPVWVDRQRPWISVLDRSFGWPWIGMMFAVSIGAFIVAYGNLPNCAVADLVKSERRLPKLAFALLWNLSVLPALWAVLVLSGQPVMWVLATLLATAIGVMLALLALKACFARRRPH